MEGVTKPSAAADGDERPAQHPGAGPLLLGKDGASCPGDSQSRRVVLMSFAFCSEEICSFSSSLPKNWIHAEEQQYMENGIFCLLK